VSVIGQLTGPAEAPKDRDAAIRQAARQLEGVFVSLMFEEMAKTVDDAGLFPKSPGGDMYQQWFRGAVAEKWTGVGGTGLGDQIAASLGAQADGAIGLRDLKAALQTASGKVGTTSDSSPALLPRVAPSAKPSPLPASAGPDSGPTAVRLPVPGVITSGFGSRSHPVTGRPDHHHGVDIAVPEGTPVRTPYAGRVHELGESPALGRYLVVEHQGGYRSLYGHLSETDLERGELVRAGEVIGRSGNTGRSTGPHLHFGLYRDGRAVDPTVHLR